ncbi:hypothetical protein I3842_03G089200 [Carya illinoinensis]|uniref:Transmembrane protein n=1 Tax=Carya illinoinensis TaxID=32201 RepID=A0A922FE93_CARIL|nr:hypothetical protein I3842_03G089200 [Carya illinoinensis]
MIDKSVSRRALRDLTPIKHGGNLFSCACRYRHINRRFDIVAETSKMTKKTRPKRQIILVCCYLVFVLQLVSFHTFVSFRYKWFLIFNGLSSFEPFETGSLVLLRASMWRTKATITRKYKRKRSFLLIWASGNPSRSAPLS